MTTRFEEPEFATAGPRTVDYFTVVTVWDFTSSPGRYLTRPHLYTVKTDGSETEQDLYNAAVRDAAAELRVRTDEAIVLFYRAQPAAFPGRDRHSAR